MRLLVLLAEDVSPMSRIKKFEVAVTGGGFTFKTDPTQPDDLANLGRFLNEHKDTLKEFVASSSLPAPVATIPVAPSLATQYSSQFQSIVDKYEIRKKKELASKTVYQYVRTFHRFKEWAQGREGFNPLLMGQIDKKFISLFIEYMQANGYQNNTIDNNYLGPLSTLFDFAVSIGEYPDIVIPSRGHKLKGNKGAVKEDREPFTTEDLKAIFSPTHLLKTKHPDYYWLPILGLYTGARINELCQLTIIDIAKIDGIPSFIITDENGGSLKNEASRRCIPIHPEIIKLGFLDYVDDIKQYGPMVFPTLLPDTFGSYIKEPSRRFGEYLDKIGITEASKVFHSFRHTVNNLLKANGVIEEVRSDFVGHENEGINSTVYAKKHKVHFLMEKVIPHLHYEDLDLSPLAYTKGRFKAYIPRRIRDIEKTLRLRKEKEKELNG